MPLPIIRTAYFTVVPSICQLKGKEVNNIGPIIIHSSAYIALERFISLIPAGLYRL